MRSSRVLVVAGALIALASCTSSKSDTSGSTTAPKVPASTAVATFPTAPPAVATAAPTVAPTEAPTAAPTAAPTPPPTTTPRVTTTAKRVTTTKAKATSTTAKAATTTTKAATTTTKAATTTATATTVATTTTKPATTVAAAGGSVAGATTTTVACTTSGGTGSVAANINASSTLLGADVRVGLHPCFERIVIEFGGSGSYPGYQVKYIADSADLAGTATLQVALGAAMTDSTGAGYKGSQDLKPNSVFTIEELRLHANANGRSQWDVGLDRKRPFVVSTLSKPARLVIDIQTG